MDEIRSPDDAPEGAAGELDAAMAVAFAPRAPTALGESQLGGLAGSRGAALSVLLPDEPSGEARYRGLCEIGRGGLGIVLRGEDRDLGREIAIKVLRPDRAGSRETIRRLVGEARIGGQLQHPGIVPVYDLGLADDHLPFFTMRLVRGRPLSAALAAREAPARDHRRLLGIFEQICQTVAYAHSRGVIHRDLKPANILLGAFGEVSVVDWGLSKVTGRPDEPGGEDLPAQGEESLVGTILGTPHYMPPEQAAGRADAGPPADVFALGAILLEILTGEPPWRGSPEQALAQARRADLAGALARLDATPAAPGLRALCRLCLAPDPAARLPDGAAVAAEISGHLADLEERARQAEVAAASERATSEEDEERERRARQAAEWQRGARRRTNLLAAAVLVVVVVAGALFVLREGARSLRAERAGSAAAEAIRRARLEEGAGNLAAALGEGRRAAALARDGADAAVVERADTLLAHLTLADAAARKDAERAERDRAFLDRLADLRTHPRGEGTDWEATDAAFAQAFVEFGFEGIATNSAGVAAGLRGRPGAPRIAAALEEWAFARRAFEGVESEGWPRLLEAAREIEPAPWRDDLHRALVTRDRQVILDLVLAADIARLPPGTIEVMALFLARGGQGASALDLLRKAWPRHPDDLWLAQRLGNVLSGRADPDYERAARMALVTVALQPSNGCHWATLCIELRRAGEVAHAIAAGRSGLGRGPEHALHHVALAEALHRSHDLDGARDEARQALDMSPGLEPALNVLAGLLFDEGLLPEAIALLEPPVTDGTAGPFLLLNYGHLLGRAGRRLEAIDVYRRALGFMPGLTAAWIQLGCELGALGLREEAMDAWRDGLAHAPRNSTLWYNLANAFLHTGEFDRALGCYRKTLEIEPKNAAALCNVGYIHMTRGEHEEAIEVLSQAVEADPKLSEAWTNLGNSLDSMGRAEEAMKAFRRAIDADPRAAEAWHNLGVGLKKLGDAEGAIEAFGKALEYDPGSTDTIYLIGTVYGDLLEDYDRAIQYIRRAIALGPPQGFYHEALGLMLTFKGESAAAAAAFRDSLALDPRNPRVLQRLGIIHLEAGEFGPAAERFREAVACAPRNLNVHFGLGWLLVTDPDPERRRPEEALEIAERLLADQPEIPQFRALSGVAKLRLGRTAEAIADLEKAMELRDGGDANEWFWLALAKHRAGDTTAARVLLARAIAWVEEHGEDRELAAARAEVEAEIAAGRAK